MCRLAFCTAALLAFVMPAVGAAQGLLIVDNPNQSVRLPRPITIWPGRPVSPITPTASYRIKTLDVQARLIDQVAEVQVSQTFVNNGSQPLEVAFVFPLPYDGAISQMTLMIDGREFPAQLLKAADARRMYEEIVRRNRDPALLEWMGTGLFRTNVFPVPPGASRTVSLRYSQLCRNVGGLTDFLFPLSTARYTAEAPETLSIRLSIESQDEIKNVYSPTHAVEIKRPDERHAVVTFTSRNELPAGDFRLFYGLGKGRLSTRVLSYRPDASQDGYFLLLASPEIKAADRSPPSKTVIFVIDRSGSMSGEKIEQVRGALKYVLNNLRPGDLFNIIAYDSTVEAFRPELQRFDEQTRNAALAFVDGLYAGGTTDIDAAMRTALSQVQDAKRPNYVVFLTDGLPTSGETNEMKIVANAKALNRMHARLFAFGVGYDLNSRLLDKLVRENYGQSEYVRPNENIEDRVSRLYNRIESPVMTNVRLQFVFETPSAGYQPAPRINRVYPKDSFDLFAGEQLVLVGRYRTSGTAKVVVQGMVGDKQQTLGFPATLVDKSRDESFAFVEKLWAIRRVGEILDELDLKGKNQELITELVELATRHGILTPYTSFMADEGVSIHDFAGNAARAGGRLESLKAAEGELGFAQRRMKGGLQNAQQAAPAASTAPGDSSGMFGAGATASAMARRPAKGTLSPAVQSAGKDATRELSDAGRNIRQIGNRTFYHRNNQWVDSQVSKSQMDNARRIKQFSDEYFKLAEQHGRTLSQYLVFDEPVLVNVGDQAYLIEP
ncbi:MAG: VWA domain-containing protein [Planctomycetaceae bacterium]|nr:VWA domain-containing protein [Planctomycetaceae bacterium]